MNLNVDKIVAAYGQITQIPSVISGSLQACSDSRYKLNSVWQQRDLERGENIKFSRWSTIGINESEVQILEQFAPQEINKELLSSFSPGGKRRAVIREVVDKDVRKMQYLEVWNESKKIVNLNLKELEKHGDVHCNDQFGSFEWSEDGKKLLYIAEEKPVKTRSYFKPCKKDDDSKPGDENLWKESWGEQLTDAHHPTVCVFDVETKEISLFSNVIPDELSVGQAIWHHDNKSVIFVAWLHEPYRLGLRYCSVRNSRLYLLNVENNMCILLSDENGCVRSPCLHPKENCVYYLENEVGGPHIRCSKLMVVNISTNFSNETIENKVVVDIVNSAKSNNDFPGLYAMRVQSKCWSSDGKFLFMTSAWKSHNCALQIDVKEGHVTRITGEGDWCILDVTDDIIVASYCTPSNPPEIRVAKLNGNASPTWTTVIKPGSEANIKWSVHAFKPNLVNPVYPHVDCEYILMQPTGDAVDVTNKSLVVNPHGGPHVHSAAGFSHAVVGMVLLGFTVVQVNYRGSSGFGQNAIDSLPGKAGTQDVGDVHQVAQMLKKELRCDRVFLTGGSHGGFLSLHMISQFPSFYLAACVRNPVANMSIMYGTTDIPDWLFCESGVATFDSDILPAAEFYSRMFEKSPIAFIRNAKAPCLMMLGDADLRVPHCQGLQWAKLYKALGKTCKVLEYKGDNHSLAKVGVEADAFVNMVMWFKEHENAQLD